MDIVLGSSGFIGSNLVKYLSAKYGKNSIIRISKSKKGLKTKKNFYEIDLKDRKKLINLKLKDINKVYICAGVSKTFIKKKLEGKKQIEDNKNILKNIILFCKKNKVKNIIFSSTAALYGYPKSKTISETDETKPINPYGFSKLYAEQAIEKYSDQFDINYAILRYFNAVGADKDCEIGEDHSPETHLIPLLINAAINNKTLKVFGKNFNTVDGTGVRDYIHVEDLASAHYLALKKILNSKKSFKINLGTEKGYSVNQIIKMAEKIFKCKIKKKYFPRRPGDTAKLVSSSRKAKKILGWTAKKSQLSNILLTAYKWHYKIRKNKRTHLIK